MKPEKRYLLIWRRDAEGLIWIANALYGIPEWHFLELTPEEEIAFSGGWHAC
jgi:hypothetical protein